MFLGEGSLLLQRKFYLPSITTRKPHRVLGFPQPLPGSQTEGILALSHFHLARWAGTRRREVICVHVGGCCILVGSVFVRCVLLTKRLKRFLWVQRYAGCSRYLAENWAKNKTDICVCVLLCVCVCEIVCQCVWERESYCMCVCVSKRLLVSGWQLPRNATNISVL